MKKVLLVSNTVMHYRVSVYNYFFRRFRERGWEFLVRSDKLQKENPHPILFDYKEIPFSTGRYMAEINRIRPDVVILFLHLKDFIVWPLVHWLKMKRIPVINWTKGANLDEPDNRLKYHLFNYIHGLCDGIILYSKEELKYIKSRYHGKVTYANNTLNFEDFPDIKDSRDAIKRELGIPYGKVVLSVGRMGVGGRRKKIQHLIEVFAGMDRNDYGLVIVGSGVDGEKIKNANNGNIRYLGEIYDPENIRISKIFKMADVFSIPGHVGLGLNQAFYWGLPVVTENGLQPPEIHYLVDGRNGFIVPDGDLGELKKKILFLLENDDARERFSKNAREDILSNGSVDNMFMGFMNCIDMVFDKIPAR
ncbi:MAG: glycosyltransferase family 4 protein [Deltaproteobacteria bacterium]